MTKSTLFCTDQWQFEVIYKIFCHFGIFFWDLRSRVPALFYALTITSLWFVKRCTNLVLQWMFSTICYKTLSHFKNEWGDTLFSIKQGWNVRISFSWLKNQGLEKCVRVLTLVCKGVHLDPFCFSCLLLKRVKIFSFFFCNCVNISYASFGKKKNHIGCIIFTLISIN